jgi:hypothetical protein
MDGKLDPFNYKATGSEKSSGRVPGRVDEFEMWHGGSVLAVKWQMKAGSEKAKLWKGKFGIEVDD